MQSEFVRLHLFAGRFYEFAGSKAPLVKGSWLGAAETERLSQICDCRRLRRPYLFSRKRKDRGEKSAGMRLVRAASEFRQVPMFQASFHTIVTSRASWYAPPDTGASSLQLVAVEYLQ